VRRRVGIRAANAAGRLRELGPMGAALWHGTITALRHALACPRCSHLAGVDHDGIGRTIVICGRCGTFPMPLTVGGNGPAWPVDVAGLAHEAEDFVPRSTTARRCIGFDGAECFRAVGPRSIRCSSCAKLAGAVRLPCVEPECSNTRGPRADRCAACARERIRHKTAERRTRHRSNKSQPVEQNRT